MINCSSKKLYINLIVGSCRSGDLHNTCSNTHLQSHANTFSHTMSKHSHTHTALSLFSVYASIMVKQNGNLQVHPKYENFIYSLLKCKVFWNIQAFNALALLRFLLWFLNSNNKQLAQVHVRLENFQQGIKLLEELSVLEFAVMGSQNVYIMLEKCRKTDFRSNALVVMSVWLICGLNRHVRTWALPSKMQSQSFKTMLPILRVWSTIQA